VGVNVDVWETVEVGVTVGLVEGVPVQEGEGNMVFEGVKLLLGVIEGEENFESVAVGEDDGDSVGEGDGVKVRVPVGEEVGVGKGVRLGVGDEVLVPL